MISNQQEMLSVKNAIERTVHAYFTTHATTESKTKEQDVVEDVRKYVAALYVSGQIASDFTVKASNVSIDVTFTFNGHHNTTSYLIPHGYSYYQPTKKTFVEAVKIVEKTPSNQVELEAMWADRKIESDKKLIADIKHSLESFATQFLFEPNDKTTRAAVAVGIEEYLQGAYVADYTVVCDESNNTPSRIDNCELYVAVAVKLYGSDEFHYMPITIRSNEPMADLPQSNLASAFAPATGGYYVSPYEGRLPPPSMVRVGIVPVGTQPTLEHAAPRRVFTVDVGDMSNTQATSYLEKVKAEMAASRASRAFDAAKVD